MRYCTKMLPDEYLGEEKRVWLLTGEMELVLSSLADRANRATSPSIKCGFRCESSAGRSLYQLELPLLQFIHGAWTDALGCRVVQQDLGVIWALASCPFPVH